MIELGWLPRFSPELRERITILKGACVDGKPPAAGSNRNVSIRFFEISRGMGRRRHDLQENPPIQMQESPDAAKTACQWVAEDTIRFLQYKRIPLPTTMAFDILKVREGRYADECDATVERHEEKKRAARDEWWILLGVGICVVELQITSGEDIGSEEAVQFCLPPYAAFAISAPLSLGMIFNSSGLWLRMTAARNKS